MVIVMDVNAGEAEVNAVKDKLTGFGFQSYLIKGVKRIVIGAVGDRKSLKVLNLETLPGVKEVISIMKPFKLVSREVHESNTCIDVKGSVFGESEPVLIAGPCAVESREQIQAAAYHAAGAGASILRGGAYKPRTSPYSFQGLEEKGLEYMAEAAEQNGLAAVTEVMDEHSLEIALNYVDMLQIGTRNMQNFKLLKAVGRCGKPVLLKRGLSATVEEWLMSAEYILSEGNPDVVLCERGIRSFEKYTRNTLDLSAVPLVKELSHLPVIVDPSHGTGKRELVSPMSMAAIAAGADGLIIEMHPEPMEALSDGPQSLYPEEMYTLAGKIEELSRVINGKLSPAVV
ncbi:MAG: 3-deoxy-7-phosphoheptulonate synthase [Clostridiales bacterium]|nr:3-deoxy-7-phosphoheptulonate synthase [Clostridiales bacterium]MCF8022765.1 3-deoxy-7-phosphoheptulonate synthase [Clostridiales bacterium]